MKAVLLRSGRRYIAIGAGVYVFELIVIFAAQKLGATPVWAVAISFCLGTSVSFFLQKLVTFGDKRMRRHVLVPQMLATALLVLWNLGFSVLLTNLLQNSLPTALIRTLALGLTTLWNFYLYKTQIFKTADEKLIG